MFQIKIKTFYIVENIKAFLLSNLDNITEIADAQFSDELLTATSQFTNQETGDNYELCVELIAIKDKQREPGNFHSDRGDWEGQGSFYVVSGVEVQNVWVFLNDEECKEFSITTKEAEEALKY